MIKIKDYIFNENDIHHIGKKYTTKTKELYIYFNNGHESMIIEEATFEDIEWNYENNNEYCNVFYEDRIKELEEKNKTFEDYNKDLNRQIEKLEEENEKLKEENKKLKEDYDILDKFDDKNIDDYKKLEEENKSLKTNIKTLKRRRKKQTSKKNKYKNRINKAKYLLKEYISSTKGIINDYSYHEELHKQDIINMKEDIEFYENVIKTLEGEENESN